MHGLAERRADPMGLLLSRLDGVRSYGNGYRANCPNGHRSRGTLVIHHGDDGRVLVNCKAFCSIGEVLGPIGLSVADLFDRPPVDRSPAGKARRREFANIAAWRAALAVLEHEAAVIAIAAEQISRGLILGPDDAARVQLAHERIADSRRGLAP